MAEGNIQYKDRLFNFLFGSEENGNGRMIWHGYADCVQLMMIL